MDSPRSISELENETSSRPPSSGSASIPLLWSFLGAGLLVLAIAAVYARGLQAPFFFDDQGAVVANTTIRQLSFPEVLHPPADGSTTTGRPLVNLSFAVDHALWGLRPFGFHLSNLLLHVASALLLWGLLRRLLPEASAASKAVVPTARSAASPTSPRSLWRQEALAWLLALVWALHPLASETVECVAQRTEGLVSLLLLACLYCFLRYASAATSRAPWLFLGWGACLLGMAAKELMVVTPCVIFLFDRCLVAGSFSKAWKQHRGFHLAMLSGWLVLLVLLLGMGGTRGGSAGFGLQLSSWHYLLTQCWALMHYLGLSLWPDRLVVDYGQFSMASLSPVLGQALVLCALLGASVWALLRWPRLGFVGFFFFLILSPSSSVVPLVTQTVAEHRMYLAVLAPLILLGLLLDRLPGGLGLLCLFLVAGCFGWRTWQRVGDYVSVSSIWSANIRDWPQGARAYNNLAQTLQEQGDGSGAAAMYAEAIRLDPEYVTAHYNLGVLLQAKGEVARACLEFQAAVSRAPDHLDARVNLGNSLVSLNRAAEAIPHYQWVLQAQPGATDVQYNLGLALIQAGRGSEASTPLRTALAAGVSPTECRYQLALLDLAAGEVTEAESFLQAVIKAEPERLEARRKLGLLYAQSERLPQAGEQFRYVLSKAPQDAESWANLGNVFFLQQHVKEAIACYQRSLALVPSNARVRESLELAREAQRQGY